MSNSTVGGIAKAPVNGPARAPGPAAASPVGALAAVPDYFAPPPEGGALTAAKSQASVSISWIGIAGIVAAFLILAAVAVAFFWYKRNRYKKALQEQRNFYMQNAANQIRDDWSTDEEHSRSSGKSKRGLNGARDSVTKASGDKVVDIPAYTRDPKARRSRDKIIPGSFRDKHMTRCFDSSHQGEVFYTGEEGSQMGVRYSREELGNIEILTRVSTPAPKLKRKAESESVSLLGTLSRSHTIAASPTKEMEARNNPGRWSRRTFSLPANPCKSAREIATRWDPRGERKIEDSKAIPPLTPHPISLPASPLGPFLSAASNPKPSRLAYANFHHPKFIVPPSTPPPPLPLPATIDEAPEKTLQELRRAMKQAESKWTIATYCPAPPPPPLPGPFRSPASPPPPPPPPPPLRRSSVGLPSLSDANPNPNPPSFRDLVEAPAAPPPPPPPPSRRASTLPAKQLFGPPPPPPPPPRSPPSRKLTPPPSPPVSPKLQTPPASPPPPALHATVSGNGLSRPKLTPLTLPGRPDLAEHLEEFQNEPRVTKRHQKMRPLHWDKLKPDSRTVWDKMSDSLDLDEEMIENLFGMSSRTTAGSVKRFAPSAAASQKLEILDPRKAHNIAIQLRARGLSRVEVCDALIEGDGLSQETLELLVKMSPTEEEVSKFHGYKGDSALLGPADRFLLGILQIPNSFQRLDTMLYRASFKEELQNIQETIRTLEMACTELKGSRTFTKLLEVVLKTGNRLNMGTFRGDAKAFKLDTLLKLADVKGLDGKTTLLHFVIQEIIKAEGARAARLAGVYDATTPTSVSSACTTPTSASSPTYSSPLSHFARSMVAELERSSSSLSASHWDDSSRDDFRRIAVDVVRGIPAELDHVRKAGAVDVLALGLAVARLHAGLEDMKTTLETLCVASRQMGATSATDDDDCPNDAFRDKMVAFVAEAEAEVRGVQGGLDLVLASVKDISIYFYGEADTAKSTQPWKVFVVMREFLAMLEQACRDVMKPSAAAAAPPTLPPPSSKRLSLTPPAI